VRRVSRVAACALLAACSNRPRRTDAAAPIVRDVVATPDVAVSDASATVIVSGAWADPTTLGEATSNARAAGASGAVFGAVARPTEDLSQAQLTWVRWGEHGVTRLTTRTVKGTFPGGPMGLLRRGEGFTVVWFPALRDVDGAVEAYAVDANASGFTGDERPATAAETSAAAWASEPMNPRRRAGAQELAPPVTEGAATVELKRIRSVPAVMLGEVEVTRGTDLAGFEPSVGVARVEGGRTWVALTRGHCQQTRLEVFRVDGDTAVLRGRFLFGTELGVRWIRIDARRDDAVVTWTQTLIPLRIECIRPQIFPRVTDHGVRVGIVTAEGEAPPPVPDAPDGSTPADAATDASLSDGFSEAATPASTPRSP
jgi:hypothetical protein